MSEFERKIELRPSYDRRDPDPKKNYGIHNMEIMFLLIGEKGAVHWIISTGWYVASAREHLDHFRQREARSVLDERTYQRPWPTDLGYHAKEPQYDGQHQRECQYLPEGKCYYDGTILGAEALLEGFLAEGEDYLWPTLEGIYNSWFNDAPWPIKEP